MFPNVSGYLAPPQRLRLDGNINKVLDAKLVSLVFYSSMFYLTRRAKRKGLQLHYMACVVTHNLVFDPIFWSAPRDVKETCFSFSFFSHVHELRRGKARGLYQLLTALCCSDNDDSSRARAFGSVDASHLKIYPYISGSWPWLACPILRSPTF